MKKKYYFNSPGFNIVYLVMALFFFAIFVIAIIFRETTSPQSTIIVMTFCSVVGAILLIWTCFSFSMRIEIDFEKEELLIVHPYFLKRLKFDEITAIEIKDYNEVAFDFTIEIGEKTKKLAYARYYKKKPNDKITNKLNELKSDFRKICSRNY